MEPALAALVALFFAVSVYLFLSKHLIRVLLGAALMSNAVNLTIFTSGRLTREVPPFIAPDAYTTVGTTANSLPQALVLTAIVIAFSIFAFLLVLTYRAYQELATDNSDEMRLAEPEADTRPPLGY